MSKSDKHAKSMIPLNVPINSLDNLLTMVIELFERPQEEKRTGPQFVGDCYLKLVDAQKTYLFEQVEGIIVLRKGVQAKLDVFHIRWGFDARISYLRMGERTIAAFIPPF